jgi:hypothetical protein
VHHLKWQKLATPFYNGIARANDGDGDARSDKVDDKVTYSGVSRRQQNLNELNTVVKAQCHQNKPGNGKPVADREGACHE